LLQALGSMSGSQWDGAGFDVLGDFTQRAGDAQRLPA